MEEEDLTEATVVAEAGLLVEEPTTLVVQATVVAEAGLLVEEPTTLVVPRPESKCVAWETIIVSQFTSTI